MPLKKKSSVKNKKTQRKSRQPTSDSSVLENDYTLASSIPPSPLATPTAEPAQTVQPLQLTPARDEGPRVEHDKEAMHSYSQPPLELTPTEPGILLSRASSTLPALSLAHRRLQGSSTTEIAQLPPQLRNFLSSSKSPEEIGHVISLFEASSVPFDPSSLYNRNMSSEDVENMLMEEYRARIRLHEEKMKSNGQMTMKTQNPALLKPGSVIPEVYGRNNHHHVRHGPLPSFSEGMSGLGIDMGQQSPSDCLHAPYESERMLTPRGVKETTSEKTTMSSSHLEFGGGLKNERKRRKNAKKKEKEKEKKKEKQAAAAAQVPKEPKEYDQVEAVVQMAVKKDAGWNAFKKTTETYSEADRGALFSPSTESATTYEKLVTPLNAHEEKLPTPSPVNENGTTKPEKLVHEHQVENKIFITITSFENPVEDDLAAFAANLSYDYSIGTPTTPRSVPAFPHEIPNRKFGSAAGKIRTFAHFDKSGNVAGTDDQADQKQEGETSASKEGLTVIEECEEEPLEESSQAGLQIIPEAQESESVKLTEEAKNQAVDSRGSPKIESSGRDSKSSEFPLVVREKPTTIYRIPSELSNCRPNSDAVIALPASQDSNQPEYNHLPPAIPVFLVERRDQPIVVEPKYDNTPRSFALKKTMSTPVPLERPSHNDCQQDRLTSVSLRRNNSWGKNGPRPSYSAQSSPEKQKPRPLPGYQHMVEIPFLSLVKPEPNLLSQSSSMHNGLNFSRPFSLPSSPLKARVGPLPQSFPLERSWTMYFSDTSERGQHKHRLHLQSAHEYNSGLVTFFNASDLEGFFGGWKALRRAIAETKGRDIEPRGMSMQGGAGLGADLMNDDTNLHLFADGIKPMWEDKMCRKGGKFMMAGDAALMDNVFLEICLLLIGGSLPDAVPSPPGARAKSIICGVAISRRKMTRLEIWLGGENGPDPVWVDMIYIHFSRCFPQIRLFPYKPFGRP
ncbi:hypothetical protein CNBG_5533 [Cryptococcus deuterogattii R265]|uniref:uncharacterized protein n=1 Tax=Cryptococcus deuterogattii (strain R265) TaxID=294750 RepID=UPI001934F10E|nr:hypothetical protein CNBG_5533 [Cryptococcus deuterogattii R265]